MNSSFAYPPQIKKSSNPKLVKKYQNLIDGEFSEFIKNYSTKSRTKYYFELNNIWEIMPQEVRDHLANRKEEDRKFGEFALKGYDRTMREKFLLNELMKYTGQDENYVVKDNGIGNKGQVIINTNNKEQNCDFLIINLTTGVQTFVDVKFNVYDIILKAHNLSNCLGKNASILLFNGVGTNIGPDGMYTATDLDLVLPEKIYWWLLGKGEINAIIEYKEKRMRNKIIGKKFGFRFTCDEFDEFLKIKRHIWEPYIT